MILDKRSASIIWGAARTYLDGHTEWAKVQRHLAGQGNPPKKSMPAVYEQFLLSLQNRQGMMNSIGGTAHLKPAFFGFSPRRTHQAYGSDWRDLFRVIKAKCQPPSRMVISNPRSYWVHFCKGALDGAAWLAQFPRLRDFVELVDRFAENTWAAPGLPLMLATEVHGFGFALACDFLKESGWSQYAKADTHTTYILSSLGLSDWSGYATYKAMVRMAALLGETPYTVDKVLWLIGSGNLYDFEEHFETDKEEFVRQAKGQLREAGYSI